VGPTGQRHTTAGPSDEIVFHTTVRNLSSQETGQLSLHVDAGELFPGASEEALGILAPFESRIISFTATVDPNASYDVAQTVIHLFETVNDEKEQTIRYGFDEHKIVHSIDRSAPVSATLNARVLGDLIGVNEGSVSEGSVSEGSVGGHLLHGIVYDQSLVTELLLTTSLGDAFPCVDTARRDAFSTAWRCPITIPVETPNDTRVDVSLSATDLYGHIGDAIAEWTFTVDTLAPQLTLLGEDDVQSEPVQNESIQSRVAVTEMLRLEGFVGDERLLAGVRVCEAFDGYQYCDDANLNHSKTFTPTAAFTSTAALADRAHWFVEWQVAPGITDTLPVTVTAYDVAGNSTQLYIDVHVDTRIPADAPVEPSEEAIAVPADATQNQSVLIGNSDRYYRLQTLAPGAENNCLTVERLAPESLFGGAAYMEACQDAPQQLWRFVRNPSQDGYHWLQTMALREERHCLESNRLEGNQLGPEAIALEDVAFMDECQDIAGQSWRLLPTDEEGTYSLQTRSSATEKSCLEGGTLDLEAILAGAVFMAECQQDSSGQQWQLVPVTVLVEETEPVTEQPDTEQPDTEQPDTEQPDTEQPVTGELDTEQSDTGESGEPLELVTILPGQEGSVNSVSWSPEGSYLASGAADGTVQTWDVASGKSLLILEGHEGRVNRVSWSPEGSNLAV